MKRSLVNKVLPGMRRILSTFFLVLAVFVFATGIVPRVQFAGAQASTAGNPSARVWVNTNSGVYHCQGTRWYGNTKQGEYMTQKQAQDKGYRPAYGSPCA